MALNKLAQVSIDALKKKEENLRRVLMMFIIVLVLLTVVLAYMVYNEGITPMIAVPIALFPVFLQGRKNLKEIRAEIEMRDKK